MAPTFIFKAGRPFLILGTPGGTGIIGVILNVLVNVIDFQMPLDLALRAPRILNRNGATELETALLQDEDLKRELYRRGHPIEHQDAYGNVQAVYFDQDNDVIVGESDPRGEGKAEGF